MKIVLVKRYEFDVIWMRLPQEVLKQMPGLHTPHYWIPGANTIVMIDEEVSVGRYIEKRSGAATLSAIHLAAMKWEVEPIHPAAGSIEESLRRGEFEDEVAHE